MLRFAEEIILLLLEDENGKFVHVPELSMRCVLAGAVLMDLAIELRIDTDLDKLVLLDPTPVGDPLLDPTLEKIAEAEKQRVEESEKERDARYWVELTAREADSIREVALARLIERGILRREDDRLLWVFRSRRYPVIDGQAEREVKLRIMEVLFSDAIPGPRDVVIISLADSCGIFKILLSEREYKRARERIHNVRKMDLIGQAVSNSVREIEAVLALALHPPF
ncbi:MAG: GPP34 family phosphoprotein [Albidovulum sp.]|nr:GPP34 family phosphoprotein [Albidovulum sp.]